MSYWPERIPTFAAGTIKGFLSTARRRALPGVGVVAVLEFYVVGILVEVDGIVVAAARGAGAERAATAAAVTAAHAGERAGAAVVAAAGEAERVDVAGGEPAGLLVEFGLDDPLLDGVAERVPSQREDEQEPERVRQEAGREQECAGGDEEAAVHEFVCRGLPLRERALDALQGVTAFRAHEQRAEQGGEDDERDRHLPADLPRDEHQEEGVRERDHEQREEQPPESGHTPG